MKKSKKILATCMVSIFMIGAFAGCGGNADKLKPGKSVLLKISPFNGGYGLDWLDALAAEYEKENPEVQISYSKSVVDRSTQMTAIKSGTPDCDLYFTSTNIHTAIYEKTPLEPINDVYEAIGNRIDSSVKEWYEHDGNYYSIPWATGVLGIMYHKDFFDTNGIEVPRTTNELFAVADKINQLRAEGSTDAYAFAYCDDVDLGGCYLDYLANPWFAQYESIADYENYWNGITHDGLTASEAGYLNDDYKGILRLLEEYEIMLKPSNSYNHPKSKDDSFTESQTRFLSGKSIMMINGDWITQEMQKGDNFTATEVADVTLMKTPVISSIVENLPLWNEAEGVLYRKGKANSTEISEARRAQYDKVLAAIIDYVDGITTEKPTSVEGITISDEDIARVREVRSITSTMSTSHNALIPSSAKQKEEAKKFLKFMYSDKGIELYAKNVYGYGLPVNYTQEEKQEFIGSSQFMKSAYDMMDNAYSTFAVNAKLYMFSMNGLSLFYRNDKKYFVDLFAATAASNYESAYQFYTNSNIQIASKWDDITNNIPKN